MHLYTAWVPAMHILPQWLGIHGLGVSLANPYMLLLSLLALVPLLLWRRARRAYQVLARSLGARGRPPRVPLLLVFSILLLSLAASSPVIHYYREVSVENASLSTVEKIPISLVVCLDVSKSMNYRDSGLKRIDMAKGFIAGLARHIGRAKLVLLVFSNTTRLVYEGAPSNVTHILDSIGAGERYSAIGDAAAAGAGYVKASGMPGAVLVVTDGGWNYGADPVRVAEELRREKIPVIFIIVGDDPRGASLAAKLESHGVRIYRLNELSYRALGSLVEEAARTTRLEALRLAGVTSIWLPVGEKNISWLPGLAAALILALRLVAET